MALQVVVTRFDDLIKVELIELNEQGEPRDGKYWYCNANIEGVDLEAEPIELPDGLAEGAIQNLMAQREVSRVEEELNAALTDILDTELPEE